MKWRPYPAYKDSGVEWLGEIPEHWDIQKLKYIATTRFSNVDKHTVDGEQPVRLCNYVDVYYNDYVTADLGFMMATATPTEIAKFKLKKGDVIITKDSETWDDIAVPAYVSTDFDDVLCGYHLAQIRPHTDLADGEYLFRAFCARGINDQFRVAATGITRYGLGKYWLDNALFLVPPADEQRTIAAFLDRKTTHIDALIAKKERQIELLQEKRAALISHTVTKGLDPDVPMKDSGVEWLGEIPAHWAVRRAQFLYRQLHLQPCASDEIVTAFRDGQVTLRKNRRTEGYTFAIKELGYQRVRKGDLVIHSMDAFAGAIGVSESDGKCTGEYVVCEPTGSDVNNHYYAECLRWMAKQNYIYVICPSVRERAPRFRYNRFRNVLLPLPSLNEQNAIIDFCRSEVSRIDRLVSKTRKSIEILREYRTALISAAVTGKIQVQLTSEVSCT